MDCTVPEVAKSPTQLSDFHFIMSLFKKTELTKIFTIFNKHKKFITLKIWFLHKEFCKAIILQVRINTVF